MDPRQNPYAPGAGTPPLSLIGQALIAERQTKIDEIAVTALNAIPQFGEASGA